MLSKAATAAMAVVLEAMKSVCAVYDVDFREVSETHEDASFELIEEKVDFIIVDVL